MKDVDLYHDDNEFVLLSKYEKLETQLKEANSLIDYCLTETVMHSYDKDKLIEYKDKYKDKNE